jgi:peptidoglycan/LPS O-acetylase OafA/YrhL
MKQAPLDEVERLSWRVEEKPGSRSEYIPALDGLRFLAFLSVFLRHSLAQTPLATDPNSVVARYAWGIGSFGWMGVDLFLCLSAFLLTRLLLVEKDRFGYINIPHFFFRRALRIWPLYFLMILVGFGLAPFARLIIMKAAVNSNSALWQHHLIPFSLFLGNWSTAMFGYAKSPQLSLLWTVSLEEQFYLLLPLVIAALPRRTLVFVAIGGIVFSVLVRTWLTANAVGTTTIYTITPTRLDSFSVGILLAIFAPQVRAWASQPARSLLLVIVLLALLTMIHLTGSVDLAGNHLIYLYVLVACSAGCALILALSPTWFSRLLERRPMIYLGKISYGLYALHLTALMFVNLVADRFQLLPIVRMIGGLCLTIVMAAGSYRYLERPFLKLKLRFTSVPSRPV